MSNIVTPAAVAKDNVYARSLESERSIDAILDMIRTGALVVMKASGQHFVVPQTQLPTLRLRFSDAVPLVNTEPAEAALREHARQAMAVWN
jgi:hypothetical protein